MEKDVTYIARRYRKGRFSADRGWKRLGIGLPVRWRRLRVAAAVASAVVLSAVGAIVYHLYDLQDTPATVQPEIHAEEVKVIDFEDAALTTVVAKISEVYGVKVTGVPDNADDYRLSLHYEGNVDALIETINEILGTKMAVKK